MQAILDGQADVAHGSTISSVYARLDASPRGVYHPTFPKNDAEGWARAKAVMPFCSPALISKAVGGTGNLTGKLPYEGNTYPYPIFVSLPNLNEATAYGLTKAVMENYETFKDAGPGMDGYQIENQNLSWVFPYHPGSIAYFKEAGKWTADSQANNDGLLKRQEILLEAWEAFSDQDVDDDELEVAWLKARAAGAFFCGSPGIVLCRICRRAGVGDVDLSKNLAWTADGAASPGRAQATTVRFRARMARGPRRGAGSSRHVRCGPRAAALILAARRRTIGAPSIGGATVRRRHAALRRIRSCLRSFLSAMRKGRLRPGAAAQRKKQ